MFISTIDNALTFAFHRKSNVPVTFAVRSLESSDTARAILAQWAEAFVTDRNLVELSKASAPVESIK